MDLLVCSLEDAASVTIRDALLELRDWEAIGDGTWRDGDRVLWTIDDLHLYHDDVDAEAEETLGRAPDRVVFLSRHQSQAGVPSLTVHPIGNFDEARYGGQPGTLVPAPTGLVAPMLRGLAKRVPDRYEATLEATHHGPHLGTPACFVEIGSDEEAWRDEEAGRALAASLLEALDADADGPVTVAVGGGHYQPRTTDLVRGRRVRLGHMVPDYHLEGGLTEEIADLLIEATPGVEAAYLDRSRLGPAGVRDAEKLLQDRGLDVVRSDDLDPVQ